MPATRTRPKVPRVKPKLSFIKRWEFLFIDMRDIDRILPNQGGWYWGDDGWPEYRLTPSGFRRLPRSGLERRDMV